MYLCNKSIRIGRIYNKFMMVVVLWVGEKWYGIEKGNDGNFIRNVLFFLLIKKF